MRRTLVIAGMVAIALVAIAVPTNAATKRSLPGLCVGGAGCFATIQGALDASNDGDTIRIGAGTFAGGVTIAKSVNVVGAGASKTIIKGGGPVVTIGVFGMPALTVSIKGVTITGGLVQSGLAGGDPVTWLASGGGVSIPPASGQDVGAAVTITDSVVTGNRVEPTTAVTFNGDPNIAFAIGAGIASSGRLTLVRTVVSDNRAGGPVASTAVGGGIDAGGGSLTLKDSVVTGNEATVVPPNGRDAQAGGLYVESGETFAMSHSTVSNNTAGVTSSYPVGEDDTALGGGLNVDGGGGSTVIDSSLITGNTASATDPNGDPIAFAGAMVVGSNAGLTMTHTTITNNHTVADVLSEDLSSDHCCSGDVVEIDGAGTVSDTLIANNTNAVTTQSGTAMLFGTLWSFNSDAQPLTISDSVIAGNANTATNHNGPAIVEGGGIFNIGLMVIRHTQISWNTARANGQGGSAQGGGVWNGSLFGSTPQLTLADVAITRNVLSGGPGVILQGGGLFADAPVTRTRTLIIGNTPDQCFGC